MQRFKYSSKILNKRVLNEKIIEICLEKPKDFNFKAGQYIILKIINLSENVEGGNKRIFSVSSSPLDEKICLITNRGISEYKKYLEEKLKIGEEVEFFGPFGNLILDENHKVITFLAGGTGIAPFLSMIRYIFQKNLDIKMFLFYSEKKFEYLVYLDELKEYERTDKLKLIITLTQEKREGFEHGRINKEMIKKYLNDKLNESVFYIAGPPEFVETMKNYLKELEVKEEKIKTEKW
ncbi:MAG: FAD-dependent oxidoreductase [Candidatus Aenigmatarchaeota archaeon]